MKLKPVENYDEPKYSSFNLKNGKILPTGIAILTALGILSGCGGNMIASNTPLELTQKSIAHGLGYSIHPEEKMTSLFETEELFLGKIAEKNAKFRIDVKKESEKEVIDDFKSTVTAGLMPITIFEEPILKEIEGIQPTLILGMMPTELINLSGTNDSTIEVKNDGFKSNFYTPVKLSSKGKSLLELLPEIQYYMGRMPAPSYPEEFDGLKWKKLLDQSKDEAPPISAYTGAMPVIVPDKLIIIKDSSDDKTE